MAWKLKDAGMILIGNLGKNVIAVAIAYLMAINIAWAHCADGLHTMQMPASEVMADAVSPHHHAMTGADTAHDEGQCEQACLRAASDPIQAASPTNGSHIQTLFPWVDESNASLWAMAGRAIPFFPSPQWPPPVTESLVALKILLLN